MGQNCSCEKRTTAGRDDYEDAHHPGENQAPLVISTLPNALAQSTNGYAPSLQLNGLGNSTAPRLAASEYYIPRHGSMVGGDFKINEKTRVMASDTQFNDIQQKSVFELKDGGGYEGETKDGLPHGKGKEISPSGDEYIGNFVMGKKHGFGVYYKKDAYSYRGNFQHNKINGFGKIEYMDNTSYEGYFRNGIYHGEGTLYDANGGVQKGEWNNGVLVSG